MSHPSLARQNDLKSEDVRLLAAQNAYDEIMATLSAKWNVRDGARFSSKAGELRRPNGELPVVGHGSRDRTSSSNGQKLSELVINGKEKNFPHRKIQVPEIPLENLKKLSKKTDSSIVNKDRSDANARAVQSLRKAMRPVRLQHPNWMQEKLSLHGNSEENSPARKMEEVSDNEYVSEENDSVEEFVSKSEGTSTVDPRFLIDNLWDGYVLKYVKGSTATPKWSKNSSGHEKRPLQSHNPKNRSALEKSERKDIQDGIDHLLHPNVIIQKHQKKTSKDGRVPNGKNSAEPESSRVSSKSRSISSHTRKQPTVNDYHRLKSDLSFSSEDDLSSRTWNMHSPQSAWIDLETLQQNQRHLQEQIQNQRNQPRSSSSSPVPPRPRSSNKPQPTRKSKVSGETDKHQTLPLKLRERSLERYKAERLEKEVSDFAEMRNQFRAHPVPAWIRNNKFEQMTEEAEDRKERVHQHAVALLEQTQPFHFSEIPDRHSEKRKRLYANLPSKGTERQRRPLSSQPKVRVERNEVHRDVHESHLPAQSFGYTMPRNFCSKHQLLQPSFKPMINATVPDFSRLHANLDRRQEAFRQERTWTTVPRPFVLAEPEVKKDQRQKPTAGSKEVRKSDGQKRLGRRSKSLTESFDALVRPTKAFSLLAAYSKQKMKGEQEGGVSHSSAEDKQRAERLREKLLERKSDLTDMADLVSQTKQSVPSLHERSREYMEEMAEVKRRLSERPFIWERSQMDDRRKRIDARFHEILLENDADRVFQRALDRS